MSTGYNASDVIEFLDYLAEKGIGRPDTMRARRIAVGRIADTVGSSELDDVREVDIEHIMERFANLQGTKFTADSLKTYKSRLSTSISDFIRWKDSPTTFKLQGQRSPRQKPQVNLEANGKTHPRVRDRFKKRVPIEVDDLDGGGVRPPNGLELPIPIRRDLVVTVSGLPFDLSKTEAQRISNVIMAMAVVEE